MLDAWASPVLAAIGIVLLEDGELVVAAPPTQARSLKTYGLSGLRLMLPTTGAVYSRQFPPPYANETQPCVDAQRDAQPLEVTSVGVLLM